MTKSTITRERIQRIIRAIDSESYDEEEIREWLTSDEIMELARMALAAMDSEPVAEVCGDYAIRYISSGPAPKEGLHPGDKLYRHAQPVVQCPYPCGWDTLNNLAIQDAAFVARGLVEGEPVTESLRQAAISSNDRLLKVIAACRAAMLQTGNSSVIPEGSEQRIAEAVELLKRAAPAMLADDSGPNGPLVGRLKSPVAADDLDAAAPTGIPMISDRWIPVSERMPESNGVYFGWDGKRVLEVNCFFGGFSANQFIHGKITHWMPLPAAPQEVKGEQHSR